jgi:hypothetical protein
VEVLDLSSVSDRDVGATELAGLVGQR